jgi:hypothetical protein
MEKLETDKDLESGSESQGAAIVRKYLAQIRLYDDEFSDWQKVCKSIRKRYRDEQADKQRGRFNIYWANIENQKANIFFRAPRAEIQRRNKDKSPVARVAAESWERNTQYSIDSYNFKGALSKARDEYLMYSRALVRVRYYAELVDVEMPVTDEMGMPVLDEDLQPLTEVKQLKKPGSEKTYCEFVHRDAFRHSPGIRTWEENTLCIFDAYMTRDQLIERFGKEKGAKVSLDYSPYESKDGDNLNASLYKKALIHEVWDKETKKVYWISPGYKDTVLDEEDDPLNLEGFFPCPQPAYLCVDTDSLVPITEFTQVESLTKELDEVGNRKAALTNALRVKGIYDASCPELAELVEGGPELDLIASTNYAALMQKGGLQAVISFMPIEQIANVLRSLIEIENNIKQQLYEVSGMSDIIRGATDPRETATSQSIKNQHASKRTNAKQDIFSDFVRDVVKIMAEVIVEQYDPETFAQIAGIEAMGEETVQIFPQAFQMLQDERVRNYQIDIETDSTLAADDQEEKQQAIEFINVLTQGLNDTLPIIQAMPQAGKLLSEAVAMVTRKFKAGRGLEDALDEFSTYLSSLSQQPQQQPQPQQQGEQPQTEQQPPPGMDPAIIKAQAEAQMKAQQLQQEGAIKQAQMQQQSIEHQDKMQIEQGKLMLKAEEIKAREAAAISKQGGFTI